MTDPRVVHCSECDAPWGVVLLRGVQSSRAWLALAVALREYWGDDADQVPIQGCEVVRASWADLTWFDDNGICEPTMEADCWYEVGEGELPPSWWVKRRKKSAFRARACGCSGLGQRKVAS